MKGLSYGTSDSVLRMPDAASLNLNHVQAACLHSLTVVNKSEWFDIQLVRNVAPDFMLDLCCFFCFQSTGKRIYLEMALVARSVWARTTRWSEKANYERLKSTALLSISRLCRAADGILRSSLPNVSREYQWLMPRFLLGHGYGTI